MALKWGICSAGNICNDFTIALNSLPQDNHKVVAVASRDIERSKKFASEFGIQKAYGSYKELAADPDVDIAYIGTIHPFHKELSILMLDAGKHVLCEKPVTMNTKELEEVLQKAKEKKLFFMEGIWCRFFPATQQLIKELSNKTIGEPEIVEVDFGVKFPFPIDNVAKGDSGMFYIGVYTIQFATLVFGNEKPEKITACGHVTEAGVDYAATITLLYSRNRIATLMYSVKTDTTNRATIYGTKGKLMIPDFFFAPLELITPEEHYKFELHKTEKKPNLPRSEGLAYEAEAVRQSINQGLTEHPHLTHDDIYHIMTIIDEVRRQLGLSCEARK